MVIIGLFRPPLRANTKDGQVRRPDLPISAEPVDYCVTNWVK
jgi:hypothetical protein